MVCGAKAHNTLAPYAHELIVLPTRDMRQEDADYAVAFAIPADAAGITMICRGAAPSVKREMTSPFSSRYASVESLTVFDHVFVPWERVFMCGEWQLAGYLAETFATYHRHSYCGCKPAISDLLLGAAALVAEYNGIQKAHHVRDKLIEFMVTAELVHGCGLAASMKGQPMTSGTYLPDLVYANVGKYYAGTNLHHEAELVQDLAGGLVVTMPSEEDYQQPGDRRHVEEVPGRSGRRGRRRPGALLPADRGPDRLQVRRAGDGGRRAWRRLAGSRKTGDLPQL